MDIKHRVTGKVLFSSEKKTLKEAVTEAVEKKAYLGGAYLGGADLRGADLREAYLREAYLRGADLGGIKITEKEKETIIKELQWKITK